MFIAIYAGGMPFDGETIRSGKSLGGSESAAYYMARALAARGHHVTVFTSAAWLETGKRTDGVTYAWHGPVSERFPLGERFALVLQAPHDVLICQRHPLAFRSEYNTKVNIWWLHDLALGRHAAAVAGALANIDRVFTVSQFHKHQVGAVYGIPENHIHATANGVDYQVFMGRRRPRRRKHICFAARPERGLTELVGPDGIMERLGSHYHLHVAGYDNTVPAMAEFYRWVWGRCDAMANVTRHGALGKRELYKLLASCQVYCYPTVFEDTSCILVLESLAAGTPVIGCAHAAIPETAAGGGAALVPLRNGAVDIKAVINEIRQVCGDDDLWRKMHRRALEKRQGWDAIAEEWEGQFEALLAAKSDNPVRLARHYERMSDVRALLHSAGDDPEAVEARLPGFARNYNFFLSGDYTGHYAAYYAYEAARGADYGPEDLAGEPRFEQTAAIVQAAIPEAATILDYGCAHGHYTINLAARLPGVELVGVDISERNIATARRWAKDAGLGDRVRFHVGDESALESIGKEFDCVLACEVLEHVADPAATVSRLLRRLKPGGTLVVTTPYGPWEAIGYARHPGWRAHVHHMERADLFELFGQLPDYKTMALPRAAGLGHFITTFRRPENGAARIGAVDYARKHRQQAPRETVSVCLIARDEAHNIGRCLEKVADIADEIIVGVDYETTDATAEVAREFGAQCFPIASPLATGFDRARNATIEKARMDWILWLDCDETLENADELAKWLRPNCYDAYGVPQQHHSAEPAGLVKTDFPARLFRNCRGITFFGHVHEHPETALNQGPGKVMILPDVWIMHTGYATEAVRRQRFERNWPLMQEDRRRFPERRLGQFLYLRDIAQLSCYDAERGRAADIAQAQEAVKIWRDLLAAGETRLVVEGLPYYSTVAAALGGRLQFALDLEATAAGNGGPQLGRKPLVAVFLDPQDAEGLAAHLVGAKLKPYGEKYY